MAGYQAAIDLAKTKLDTLDPGLVVKRIGAKWENGKYHIPWFGEFRELYTGSTTETILWLHYLISEGTKPPEEINWIPYRDLPGAKFYEPKFVERGINPLIRRFGKNPEALIKAGLALNGKQSDMGDASIILYPFPLIPIIYIIWEGDDEMEAGGGILFDHTAVGWFNAEDMAVLGSEGVYKLMKQKI